MDNAWTFHFFVRKSKEGDPITPCAHSYVFSALEPGARTKAELISKVTRYANRLGSMLPEIVGAIAVEIFNEDNTPVAGDLIEAGTYHVVSFSVFLILVYAACHFRYKNQY